MEFQLFFCFGVDNTNCSTPNLAQTSTELSQCKGVRGSIIIHHPTTTTTTTTFYSTLLYSTLLYSPAIAIYSLGQQKEINYSAPIRDIELKFWG